MLMFRVETSPQFLIELIIYKKPENTYFAFYHFSVSVCIFASLTLQLNILTVFLLSVTTRGRGRRGKRRPGAGGPGITFVLQDLGHQSGHTSSTGASRDFFRVGTFEGRRQQEAHQGLGPG